MTIPGTPDPWWEDGALRAIEQCATTMPTFTAYDVAKLIGNEPDHPCRWGGVFTKAASLKLIERVGYQSSKRPSRGYGVCAVWQAGPALAEVAA